MALTLDIGTIDINDKELINFVENRSVDEIKKIFINLLKNNINTTNDDLDTKLKNLKVINPQKGKRVREALNSLNKKLEPLKNGDLEEKKEKYFKEKFVL